MSHQQPAAHKSTITLPAAAPAGAARSHPAHVSEIDAALLRKIERLLADNHVQQACDAVRSRAGSDPWLKNAFGVCLMRNGDHASATRILRQLALESGGVWLRKDAPTIFKTNFATALLLSGQPGGCVNILDEIADESHPAVARLRGAIGKLKSQLGLGRRLLWKLGLSPTCTVSLDFLPGDLA